MFDDTFFFEGNTHLPIEQHATVATKDPDGKLVVYSSTQTPHYLHRALSKALAIPAAHIRVVATPNGGGFGGKSDPFNHEVVVAHAAMRLDRPVKIALTREEVFYCHRGRHPVLMRFRAGVTNDGRVTGLEGCMGCARCVVSCPTDALEIRDVRNFLRPALRQDATHLLRRVAAPELPRIDACAERLPLADAVLAPVVRTYTLGTVPAPAAAAEVETRARAGAIPGLRRRYQPGDPTGAPLGFHEGGWA